MFDKTKAFAVPPGIFSFFGNSKRFLNFKSIDVMSPSIIFSIHIDMAQSPILPPLNADIFNIFKMFSYNLYWYINNTSILVWDVIQANLYFCCLQCVHGIQILLLSTTLPVPPLTSLSWQKSNS